MAEKKHKGGYELLKEKYNEEVREHQALETKYTALEKERDEWKAKYKQKFRECIDLQNNKVNSHESLMNVMQERDKWREECQKCIDREKNLKSRISFLLDHRPFWVRWAYRKQFEKGGN